MVNFGQSALDALTHGPLNGDSTPINIGLGAISVILGLILTIFIIVRSRVFVNGEIVRAADEEVQKLLSDEDLNGYGTLA